MTRPLFRRLLPPKLSDQFDEELRLHVELLTAELRRRGLSDDDALTQARTRIGNTGAIRNECLTIGQRMERRMLRHRLLDTLTQDVHFALRSLRRQKGWTAVVLLTLALGIGANAAVFSVVNATLLHPVPYPGADRIVQIYETLGDVGSKSSVTLSPFSEAILAWRANAKSFDAIEPYASTDMTLARGDAPIVAHASQVMPTLLAFAGAPPILGRGFVDDDAVAGAPRVVMLGEGMWRRNFGGDRAIIGQSISLDGQPYIVIGVVPRRLTIKTWNNVSSDIWLPLVINPKENGLQAVARLRPGISIATAQHELDALQAPAGADGAGKFKTKLLRPAEMVSFRDSLMVLWGAVALVLLIACANVAHLLLARGAARERELAVRAALGAGRGRLFRQLFTEGFVLSGAGTLAGLALGWAGLHVLVATRPERMAALDAATLDPTVVAVTVGISLLTGLLFGLTGVVQFAGRPPQTSLKNGAQSVSSTVAQKRFRGALIVSEMAISATLLVGAILLIRSVIGLQHADPGFDATGLFAVQIVDGTTSHAKDAPFYDELALRAGTIAGVTGTTLANAVPPSVGGLFGKLEIDGAPDARPASFMMENQVVPGFFAFMKIRFSEGGTFTDTTATSSQIIINQTMARKYWPGVTAIGKRLRYTEKMAWLTVVGVVSDVGAPSAGPATDALTPMLYGPASDHLGRAVLMRVRGDGNPILAIRHLVASMDARLPPPRITSVADALDESIAGTRFTMLLLTVFAVMAVVLSAIGLYGVLAYAVAQRTREIGIRMALGATHRDVIRTVAFRGVALALLGGVIGLVAARLGGKLVASMLYGVTGTDWVSFGVGAAVVGMTASAACLVPARRATRIDPVRAIRAE